MADRELRLGRKFDQSIPYLNRLIDTGSGPQSYRDAMLALGGILGLAFTSDIDVKGKNVVVVATVEDADFLARSFVEALKNAGAEVGFACLWIERTTIGFPEEQDIAGPEKGGITVVGRA